MSELYQSLSYSKWDCQYPVVLVPKRRRKLIFGQARRQLGAIFHALARQKHRGTSDARPCACGYSHSSQAPVSKGRVRWPSLAGGAKNETLQAGISGLGANYAVSSVGFELEQVRQYLREQEAADGNNESF
jgi:putative transposase